MANAEITLVTRPQTVELVEHCPYVDKILTYDSVISFAAVARKVWQPFRFASSHLRAAEFDLALVPRWDIDWYEATLIAFFSNAPERISFSEWVSPDKVRLNRLYDRLLTRTISDASPQHEVRRSLSFLHYAGFDSLSDSLELWLTEADRDTARRITASAPGRTICLGIGAGAARRRWPSRRYIDLVSRLRSDRDWRFVLVGSKEDYDRGERIAESCDSAVINCTGRLSLRESAALMEHVNLFIGNDSGPAQMASAAGTPGVVLSCHPRDGDPNHPNSPIRFRPWGNDAIVLQPERALHPCSSACIWRDPHCISQIGVEDVVITVDTVLRSSPQRSHRHDGG